MTIERKVGMGIAGQPSGDGPTDVADVFNAHPYTGNGSTQTITNGIDLDGKGGMVWLKSRSNDTWHKISDTERGANKLLYPNEEDGESTVANTTTSFNSNGFSLGAGGSGNAIDVNKNGRTYASWTFRKKKKFFDIQEFSSNSGTHGTTTHSHDLGTTPAMMIVKVFKRSNGQASGGGWFVFHKNVGSGLGAAYILLNSSAALGNLGTPAITVNDTQFTFRSQMTDHSLDHIAYLFADNSSEDAEDQMIKCGSYTGSSSDVTVSLGWEPQFVLIKNATSSSNWAILDTLRGMPHGDGNSLVADSSAAENGVLGADNLVNPIADGFIAKSGKTATNQNSSSTHIYMAIRAPMMVEPEAATEVFKVDTRGSSGDGKRPSYRLGSPVDMLFVKNIAQANDTYIGSRLQGARYMLTHSNQDEAAFGDFKFDYHNGVGTPTNTDSNEVAWMWKRAKGYFDVVAYSGSGSAKNVAHSLGVAPEMMWVKKRSGDEGWAVYHKLNGGTHFARLESNATYVANNGLWNNTDTTASVFRVGSDTEVNQSGQTYIAYLFATLAGISKVGSYTGNGATSQNINCGFSNGARFVLIKCASHSGSWHFMDTVRGIVAGSESHLALNVKTASESDDFVDPYSAGFAAVLTGGENNASGRTYIFYAIA